ncbi:hypothetical protein AAFF_G00122170 [Aldrovandia affinis]|uniref:Uncharacterized protein n=1 Tax=Aldrovandia affinis TaxID=143900 RepID=A0AAD7RS28_9TELE|nr:hypothetical protein AAFF_G00122170 [Aldrovandia affinis]
MEHFYFQCNPFTGAGGREEEEKERVLARLARHSRGEVGASGVARRGTFRRVERSPGTNRPVTEKQSEKPHTHALLSSGAVGIRFSRHGGIQRKAAYADSIPNDLPPGKGDRLSQVPAEISTVAIIVQQDVLEPSPEYLARGGTCYTAVNLSERCCLSRIMRLTTSDVQSLSGHTSDSLSVTHEASRFFTDACERLQRRDFEASLTGPPQRGSIDGMLPSLITIVTHRDRSKAARGKHRHGDHSRCGKKRTGRD